MPADDGGGLCANRGATSDSSNNAPRELSRQKMYTACFGLASASLHSSAVLTHSVPAASLCVGPPGPISHTHTHGRQLHWAILIRAHLGTRIFLASTTMTAPIRSGWLFREAGVFKSWQRTWAVVTESRLSLFADEQCGTRKALISLPSTVVCQDSAKVLKASMAGFAVLSDEAFTFCTDTHDNRVAWTTAILAAASDANLPTADELVPAPQAALSILPSPSSALPVELFSTNPAPRPAPPTKPAPVPVPLSADDAAELRRLRAQVAELTADVAAARAASAGSTAAASSEMAPSPDAALLDQLRQELALANQALRVAALEKFVLVAEVRRLLAVEHAAKIEKFVLVTELQKYMQTMT